MSEKWIRSALFIILSVAVTSCLKDEPFKLPFSGFNPAEKDDGWVISTLSAENIDSVKLDRALRYLYREDEYYLVRSM
ncbi:MAG: hypothetical protein IH591_08890, partial [Bacteroidales bacterium]|nr:hypothetical protein [Bacteroidales bacterium]